MNQCNGNGLCNEETNGKCECSEGWFGADCSTVVDNTDNFEIEITGTKWSYFKKMPSNATFTLSLQSNEKFDLYVKKGVNELPDPSNFDSVTKQE